MRQDDINDAEWRNPANWSWRGPLGLYGSRRDTRLIVPKAVPAMGFTVNFAHPGCTCFLVAITLLPLVLIVALRLFA
jgi:uncharacterized membrane protein